MNTDEINNIDEYIEDLPEEVRSFIFGPELKNIKNVIAQFIKNNDEQILLENTLDFYLIGLNSFEDLVNVIDNLQNSDEDKESIKSIIQEKILDELVLLIQANIELENPSDQQQIKTVGAPSPSDLLERLNKNQLTPTVFSKNEKKEPIASNTTKESSPNPTAPARVDPYREIPEL